MRSICCGSYWPIAWDRAGLDRRRLGPARSGLWTSPMLPCCSGCGAAVIGWARWSAMPSPAASRGRLLRLVDATAVPQAGLAARQKNRLWRIHSAFELPAERFGFFALTDQQGGERLDRIPVEKGEIRVADRAYMQPERIAAVIEAGADVLVRAGWKSACWLDGDGNPFDLIAALRQARQHGLIDQPFWVRRQHRP